MMSVHQFACVLYILVAASLCFAFSFGRPPLKNISDKQAILEFERSHRSLVQASADGPFLRGAWRSSLQIADHFQKHGHLNLATTYLLRARDQGAGKEADAKLKAIITLTEELLAEEAGPSVWLLTSIAVAGCVLGVSLTKCFACALGDRSAPASATPSEPRGSNSDPVVPCVWFSVLTRALLAVAVS